MTTPISPLAGTMTATTATQAQETRPPSHEGLASLDTSGLAMDKVTISSEALLKQSEEASNAQQSRTSPITWESYFGFAPGVHTLTNGNKQVVTIEDNSLEVLEYDTSGKLVKQVKGALSDDTAVLDTEIYDENGRVGQTIHTEVTGLKDTENATSHARMARTIQWFDQGELTRRMHDAMDLTSSYKKLKESDSRGMRAMAAQNASGSISVRSIMEAGMMEQPESLDEMIGSVTVDTNKTHYFASIQDFRNGRMTQDMTIRQRNSSENLTNRSDRKFGGQEPETTRELSHEASLRVTVNSYDAEGNLVREATFEDDQTDGPKVADGGLRQTMRVSWYDKGELVKRSHGELSMKEVEGGSLEKRPNILETLGIEDQEDYASKRPRSAPGLLAVVTEEAATEADHFGQALRHDTSSIVGGAYTTAADIARSGAGNNPYSVSWTNEIFRDGELAARQRDEESAIQSPVPTGLDFRTAGGLTEDENPAVLRRTEHEDQGFENGRLKREAAVSSKEFIKEHEDGPDEVRTFTEASQGNGHSSEHLNRTLLSALEGIDAEAHAAAEGFAGELQPTLDDVARTIRTMNEV